jgi:hypothetical protein
LEKHAMEILDLDKRRVELPEVRQAACYQTP